MMRIKAGLLAAIAAAALVMAFGAGSASATELCKWSGETCGGVFPAHSTFEVRGELSVTPLSFGCEYTYDFETETASGSPLVAKIPAATFKCPVTVTPVNLPWEFKINVTGLGPNGTGKIVNGGSGSPGVRVGACEYESTSIPQAIPGGGLLTAENVVLSVVPPGSCVPGSIKIDMGGIPTPRFNVFP